MTTPREVEIVGDLSGLPETAEGAAHLVWWGNVGFMVIEGTGFALAAAAYLYLPTQAPHWPPPGDRPPDLTWGVIFTVGLLLSEIPNLWVLHCARDQDARGVRIGVVAMAVIAALLFIPRGFEFAHLNVPWHHDGYGSVVWLLLMLHTTHIVTDWGDTAVLAALLTSREVEADRFADIEDNSNYWTFVVVAWLPIYVLLYWAPRAL